jgi:hypothetical protein
MAWRRIGLFFVYAAFAVSSAAFIAQSPPRVRPVSTSTTLFAQVSEKEAKTGIDKVVAALRKDRQAQDELGKLEKVTIVLGYGSPTAGSLAVRFNASFRKGGMGLSAVPLPFGLGQSNVAEGRGTMVGQVKATVDSKTGKVTSCSVFRDLGYGRSFNLKV